MTSHSLKRAVSPFLVAAAVASLLNCGGGRQESFTSQGDTSVMSGVTGTWMGSTPDGKTYTVTLCENLAATHTDAVEGCDTLHVVRGDGRGTTETTEEPTGCGGCIYTYSAFVDGTADGDDLSSTDVHGEFDLASGDANGLGFPYSVRLLSKATQPGQYNETTPTFVLSGEMKQAGVIEVSSMTYSQGAGIVNGDGGADSDAAPSDADAAAQGNGGAQITTPAFELHRVGDATCPSK